MSRLLWSRKSRMETLHGQAKGQGQRAGELIITRAPGGRRAVVEGGGDPDRFIDAIAKVVGQVQY
jgi:hypothetical protein